MLLMLLIAAAQLASPSAPAADSASRAAAEAYIRQSSDEWAQGAVADNSSRVATFIADDYRGVSSSGKVRGKREMVESYQAQGKAAGLYYVKVHFITPQLVIAQGEEWWEPKAGDGRIRLIWTDTWLFRDDAWKVVASQDSPVAADQPVQH